MKNNQVIPTVIDLTDSAHCGKGPTLICSKMVEDGADPKEVVEFIRGATPVFAPKPIQWWASRRVREADASGPMRIERVPQPPDAL